MALISCKECKHQISKTAQTCPNCGEKNKTNSNALKWILILMAFSAVFSSLQGNKGAETSTQTASLDTPEVTHKKRIESGFSAWDGSHRQLTKIIKKSMNDPDSYDHVETTYKDTGKDLLIITKYRGKNGFGGVVINSLKAKADYDGNVIEIYSK